MRTITNEIIMKFEEYLICEEKSKNTIEKYVRDVNFFMDWLCGREVTKILAFDGSSMNQINAQDVLDITCAGTSATLLAKRWQTALLVHVDNDTLKKLQNNQEALDALMNIEGFRSLNSEIQTIINRSEKVKKLMG